MCYLSNSHQDIISEFHRIIKQNLDFLPIVLPLTDQQIRDLTVLHSLIFQVHVLVLVGCPNQRAYFLHLSFYVLEDGLWVKAHWDYPFELKDATNFFILEEPLGIECHVHLIETFKASAF